ncbi:MAG TPA: hypothetical protein VK654_10450 [Nitrospirota bacterium]|nr:hypothetical protein [Nitrospirota bacterium]
MISKLPLLDNILDVHGGRDYWNSLEAVDAVISASGFLFTAKQRPKLDHVRMRAWAHEPRFAFYDFPRSGQRAELIGTNEVRISDERGTVLSRRKNPRDAFRTFRHLFSWDDLDFTYFAGYATWNYIVTPFLLDYPGFIIRETAPGPGALSSLHRLEATFPDTIPSHNRDQVFYFDEQYLLRRLDYTAEVVGGWAHAAHLCDAYQTFDGIKAPTKRMVLPLFFGKGPMPGPALVAIDVHELRPVPRPKAA